MPMEMTVIASEYTCVQTRQAEWACMEASRCQLDVRKKPLSWQEQMDSAVEHASYKSCVSGGF